MRALSSAVVSLPEPQEYVEQGLVLFVSTGSCDEFFLLMGYTFSGPSASFRSHKTNSLPPLSIWDGFSVHRIPVSGRFPRP